MDGGGRVRYVSQRVGRECGREWVGRSEDELNGIIYPKWIKRVYLRVHVRRRIIGCVVVCIIL